jgi:hypothetical protein
MAGKTKKAKSKKSSSQIIKVDSLSKVPALEKILKDGKVTIVLVFADWCGHCHNFQKNIWNPMCKKNAMHNRVAVRDDMMPNTSLKNAKIDYLPSLLVVDENGQTQSFKTPDGEDTNAMPTPKSVEEMTRIVNIPVTPLNNGMNINKNINTNMNNMNTNMNKISLNNLNSTPKIYENIPKTPDVDDPIVENSYLSPSLGPSGKTFTPIGNVGPSGKTFTPANMRGGNLLATFEQVSQGVIPAGILGSLAYALKGGSKKKSKKSKKTRKVRKH